MGGTWCAMAEGGRRYLSIAIVVLALILFALAQAMVIFAFYVKLVLEKRVAVVLGSHGAAFGYFVIITGLVIVIVAVATAKV